MQVRNWLVGGQEKRSYFTMWKGELFSFRARRIRNCVEGHRIGYVVGQDKEKIVLAYCLLQAIDQVERGLRN